jgi:hypothetical protein
MGSGGEFLDFRPVRGPGHTAGRAVVDGSSHVFLRLSLISTRNQKYMV